MSTDQHKTKAQLIEELESARQRVTELEETVQACHTHTADLQASEKLYRGLFENANDMLAIFTLDGEITHVNPAVERTLGYKREELIGRRFTAPQTPSAAASAEDRHQLALAGERLSSIFESEFIHKDGTIVPVECRTRFIRDAEGRRVGFQGIFRDITKQKQAIAALQASEERYRKLTEDIQEVFFTYDENGIITFVNSRIEKLLGYSTAEVIGRSFADFTHPDDLPRVIENTRNVEPSGFIPPVEYRLFTKTGDVRWIRSTATARIENNHVLGFHGIIVDITDRKHAEQAQRESEERYRSLVELSPDAIYVHAAGKIVYMNGAGARLYGGQSPKDFIGKKVMDLIHPDYKASVRKRMKHMREKGQAVPPLEQPIIGLNGQIIDIEASGVPITYQGQPAIQVVARDISERKRAEAALRTSEERFRSLSESAPIGIFQTDATGAGVYTNLRWQEIAGVKLDDTMGSGWLDAVIGEDRKDVQAEWLRCTGAGQEFNKEFRLRQPNGEIRWVYSRAAVMRSSQGEFMGHVGTTEDITERRQMEEALRQSEERFALAIRGTDEGVWDWEDVRTDRVYYAPRMKELLGYTNEELENTFDTFVAHLHPEDLDAVRQSINDHLFRREPYDVEYRLRTKGGEYRWFSSRGQAIWDQSGQARRMVGTVCDITERKRLEEQLLLTQFSIDHAADAAFWVLPSRRFAYVNDAACSMLGYTRGELLSMTVEDVAPDWPANHPEKWSAYWQKLKQSGPLVLEERHRRKDGTVFPVEAVEHFLSFQGQEYNFAFIRDITERKRLEVDLQEREHRYRHLVDHSLGFICTHDVEGRILSTNPAGAEALGYPASEIVGKNLRDFLAPSVRPFFGDYLERISRKPSDSGYMRIITKSGKEKIWVYQNARYTDIGGSAYVLGHAQDVTERFEIEKELRETRDNLERIVKERTLKLSEANSALRKQIAERRYAEEELRNSQVFLDSILDNMPDMLFVKDAQDLRFVRFNRAGEELTGYTQDEMLGKTDYDIVPREDANSFVAHDRAVLTSGRLVEIPEETVQTKDQGPRLFKTKKIAIPAADGTPQYLLGISEDITLRKQLEDHLRESEKLASTGRMAAGVAHEINNPLAGIRSAFLLIKDAVPHDHPHYEFVGRIDSEIDRIAKIVRQMYDLYRPEADKPRQFLLAPLIQDVVSLLTPTAKKRAVALTFEAPAAPLQVTLPESSVRQVLFNIVKNAIEASPQGQQVETALSTTDQSVTIAVTDHGSGIPEAYRAQIFEPFFSTKKNEIYAGMGLGLSISYSLVQSMGGELTFDTRLGEATVFRIHLPLSSPNTATPSIRADQHITQREQAIPERRSA